MGWDEIDAMLIISGAFGVFRRGAVVDAGGFATDTVGEDMELVVRLHRHLRERGARYRIGFVPDPVAWTECPETLSALGRQRDRWQRGLAQTLLRHRRMLFNPKYGRVGFLAYPYFFFLEMLGPLIEVAGYLAFVLALVLGTVDTRFALAFLAMAFVFGIALSITAVALEELTFRRYRRFGDILRLFALSVLENVGYRQLNACWRIRGMLRVRRTEWGAMQRVGFGSTTPGPEPRVPR
jgi:cellulose synthase/poly-beta-1,6-N-acetylglucosamine synthase-like glycosyltransferase